MRIEDADLSAFAVLIAIRISDFYPDGYREDYNFNLTDPIMLAISLFSNHQKAGIT